MVYCDNLNSLHYNLAIPFKDGATFVLRTATQSLQPWDLENVADTSYLPVTKCHFWSKILNWKCTYKGSRGYPAVTYATSQHQGRLFWIVCKQPAFLSSFSRLKLIQNSAPSVAGMRQCDIRIVCTLEFPNSFTHYVILNLKVHTKVSPFLLLGLKLFGQFWIHWMVQNILDMFLISWPKFFWIPGRCQCEPILLIPTKSNNYFL